MGGPRALKEHFLDIAVYSPVGGHGQHKGSLSGVWGKSVMGYADIMWHFTGASCVAKGLHFHSIPSMLGVAAWGGVVGDGYCDRGRQCYAILVIVRPHATCWYWEISAT